MDEKKWATSCQSGDEEPIENTKLHIKCTNFAVSRATIHNSHGRRNGGKLSITGASFKSKLMFYFPTISILYYILFSKSNATIYKHTYKITCSETMVVFFSLTKAQFQHHLWSHTQHFRWYKCFRSHLKCKLMHSYNFNCSSV